jgi:gtrA family protein
VEQQKKSELIKLIKEFMRYLVVGGTAFLVDLGILTLTKNFIFYSLGETGTLIATACGFIAGLIYNYILSIFFVFEKSKEKVKGKQLKSFLVFAIIGVIGLGLTMLGMHIGITIFGDKYYAIIKVFVAGVVLIWNYVGRKILIFR